MPLQGGGMEIFMINENIIKKLGVITDEEKRILNGENIDKNLYMAHAGSKINCKKLLKSGKLISVRPHTRFVHFPKHSHDYIEMIYSLSGQTTHIINGNKIVLKQGELLILGQNAGQEILPASKDDISINFIILPEFFDNLFTVVGDEATPLKKFIIECLKNNSDKSGYLYFEVSDIVPVQNLVENLICALVDDNANDKKILRFTMALLFMQLTLYTDRLAYQTDDEFAIMEMLRYVDENYKDGSLTYLAKSLHYDFYWFSREIKKKTGKTYTEIVQEKRLSKALSLLANTDMNISDIAMYVGYDNVSYFHRLFAKHYGVTPHQWRKNHLTNKDTV